MDIVKVSCKSCGAPIQIPSDVDSFSCAHCGTALVVQRGEGYIALKIAEHITRSIEDTATKTQGVIHTGTQVTQYELKRLQITQEIATLTTSLGNIQAQLRYLNSSKQDWKIKKQIVELQVVERETINKINFLQSSLLQPSASYSAVSGQSPYITPAPTISSLPSKPKTPFTKSPIKMGCLAWFVSAMILMTIAMAINPALGNSTSNPSDPLSMIASIVSIIIGIVVAFRVARSATEAQIRNQQKPEVANRDLQGTGSGDVK